MSGLPKGKFLLTASWVRAILCMYFLNLGNHLSSPKVIVASICCDFCWDFKQHYGLNFYNLFIGLCSHWRLVKLVLWPSDDWIEISLNTMNQHSPQPLLRGFVCFVACLQALGGSLFAFALTSCLYIPFPGIFKVCICMAF